jgi:hypothetical protein
VKFMAQRVEFANEVFRIMFPSAWILGFLLCMAGMQGMSANEEHGSLMDRDIRAPFNGMRGEGLQADDYYIYSRVSFCQF